MSAPATTASDRIHRLLELRPGGTPISVPGTLDRTAAEFVHRVSTFQSRPWHGRPPSLSPLECARHGWSLSLSREPPGTRLHCNSCSASLSVTALTAKACRADSAFASRVLRESHHAHCHWREGGPIPESSSVLRPRASLDHFSQRLSSLLSGVPPDRLVLSVAAAARAAERHFGSARVLEEVEEVAAREVLKGGRECGRESLRSAAVAAVFGWQSEGGKICCGICNRRFSPTSAVVTARPEGDEGEGMGDVSREESDQNYERIWDAARQALEPLQTFTSPPPPIEPLPTPLAPHPPPPPVTVPVEEGEEQHEEVGMTEESHIRESSADEEFEPLSSFVPGDAEERNDALSNLSARAVARGEKLSPHEEASGSDGGGPPADEPSEYSGSGSPEGSGDGELSDGSAGGSENVGSDEASGEGNDGSDYDVDGSSGGYFQPAPPPAAKRRKQGVSEEQPIELSSSSDEGAGAPRDKPVDDAPLGDASQHGSEHEEEHSDQGSSDERSPEASGDDAPSNGMSGAPSEEGDDLSPPQTGDEESRLASQHSDENSSAELRSPRVSHSSVQGEEEDGRRDSSPSLQQDQAETVIASAASPLPQTDAIAPHRVAIDDALPEVPVQDNAAEKAQPATEQMETPSVPVAIVPAVEQLETAVAPIPAKRTLREMLKSSGQEVFEDPVRLHAWYCPWVRSRTQDEPCGWQEQVGVLLLCSPHSEELRNSSALHPSRDQLLRRVEKLLTS